MTKRKDIPEQVIAFLQASARRERSYRRQERRRRDNRPYRDGISETTCGEIRTQNVVQDAVEAIELSEEVSRALDTLSETQKRRVMLFYFEGYNKTEIAEMEGVSLKNVSVAIKKSLRKLKIVLKRG